MQQRRTYVAFFSHFEYIKYIYIYVCIYISIYMFICIYFYLYTSIYVFYTHILRHVSKLQRMLQCIAVCCSVLQCVAERCNVLQRVAVPLETCQGAYSICLYSLRLLTQLCCSAVQCGAVRCSALQCVAVRCSVLQCVAVCCSVLQCVAVCCSASRDIEESMHSMSADCNSAPLAPIHTGGLFSKEPYRHCLFLKRDR